MHNHIIFKILVYICIHKIHLLEIKNVHPPPFSCSVETTAKAPHVNQNPTELQVLLTEAEASNWETHSSPSLCTDKSETSQVTSSPGLSPDPTVPSLRASRTGRRRPSLALLWNRHSAFALCYSWASQVSTHLFTALSVTDTLKKGSTESALCSGVPAFNH